MKFLKNLISAVLIAASIAILAWLVVSWVDVLMHNDPITGDNQYIPGNAIVMMVDLTE